MRVLSFIISMCMLICVNNAASAKSYPITLHGTSSLVAELNRIVHNADPKASIGLQVKSMKYGDTLYAKNNQTPIIPASTLKILTAEAALLYLGPGYRFSTSFMTDARSISNGTLNGNVYLVHSGDPSLTYPDLVSLMNILASKNIHRITGNVYIDTSAYDEESFGPGWVWDDTRYCYAAPISASIINHNCLSFQVVPGKRAGNAATIVQNSKYYYAPMQNSVVTKAASSRSCYIRLNSNPKSEIIISGCMPKGRYARGVSMVVNNISEYNKSLVRSLFGRYRISIGGNVAIGDAPTHVSALATHQSVPLSELVHTMLKKSDNIIAGSLLKKMGELHSKQPGSWANGGQAVKQILSQKAEVNSSQLTVSDGSGLSRYNRVTPAQMMQVLNFAYHHSETSYAFISALPIAGVDGTLKHRLGNVARKVRAKTGTISGVVALAGYAVSADKEPIAFVIIVNGRTGMGWKYKAFEEQIVTALTRYSRSG